MKLNAVCLGKTAALEIRGQLIKTAYVKEAVSEPVLVTPSGIEGNEVAVHLDAIYAVSRATYDHWIRHLDGDPKDWPPGTLAENLIIDGLDESSLAVGDRLSIGDEVVLSVAGPRLPCFKLCWRLGQPDSFVPTFALSGHSGVYLNVERAGIIQAGDTVSLTSAKGLRTNILLIAKAIFSADVSADDIRGMLALPGLSHLSKFALGAKITSAEDRDRVGMHRWSGRRRMGVTAIEQETSDVKSFWLEPSDDAPLAAFHGGQFLAVDVPALGKDATRVWSLSDYSHNPTQYKLTVRRDADGKGGSAFMHDVVKRGDCLKVSAPLGRFTLDRGGFKPVLLIAAGIGITPILSMAKAHVSREPGRPQLYIVHCVRSGAEQPLRSELDALGQEDGVTVFHAFSTPSKSDDVQRKFDLGSRLTEDALRDLIGDAHIMDGNRRIDMPAFEFDCFICGPMQFQEDIRAALVRIEVNDHQIYTESFGQTESTGASTVVEKATVSFAPSGTEATWDAGENLTLLELAEAQGLIPEYACRIGLCHSCVHRLVDGEVYYDPLPASTPGGDGVLLCCARPLSEKLSIAEI